MTIDVDYVDSIEMASAHARLRGCTVYRSEPTLLLIDIDRAAALATFKQARPVVDANFGIESEERWPSKTRGHLHIIVRLKRPVPIETRIALQVALGSDPVREILALLLIERGRVEPSVLFRPPFRLLMAPVRSPGFQDAVTEERGR